MDRFETRTYDVLVVGAGGAGLRAAIEAVEQGVSVAVVCKSLLGKAHTGMAEGGVAAALATTDSRDSWKVHFRTLQDKTVHSPGVDVYMECTIARLLKDGERIGGALAYRRDSGRFIVFRTKAVVLATG